MVEIALASFLVVLILDRKRLGGITSERSHEAWLFTYRDPFIMKDIEKKT